MDRPPIGCPSWLYVEEGHTYPRLEGTEPMRVVFVITRSDNVGGAHVHVRDLASYLVAEGHEVMVLVGGTGPFTEDLMARGVAYWSLKYLVRPIRLGQDTMAIWELRRVLAALRPDLVSTHSSKAGWLGRLAAKSLRLPVLFTAHGWAFTEGVPEWERRIYALAERLATPLADRIITVSEYDRQLALQLRVAPSHKLVTVHNGVPDVPASLRARPHTQPPRLIMVARFEPQKDHFTLLRAMYELRDLQWELELVGEGPLLDSVRSEVGRLGLVERVHFLGARRDVAERLALAQIFVLVSRWEGFPRTILEAMRAGLPVVASDVGGVREAVVDGVTGFVVPRGNGQQLAHCIRRLIDDPSLRTEMGSKGRARYEQHFDFKHMVRKTVAVYRQVLSDRHPEL